MRADEKDPDGRAAAIASLLTGSAVAALAALWAVRLSVEVFDTDIRPAVEALRFGAGVLGGYIVLVTALGLTARIASSGHGPLRSALDSVTAAPLRTLLDRAVRTGVVTAIIASSAAAAGAAQPRVRSTTAAAPSSSATAAAHVRAGDPASGQRWPSLPDRHRAAGRRRPNVTGAPRVHVAAVTTSTSTTTSTATPTTTSTAAFTAAAHDEDARVRAPVPRAAARGTVDVGPAVPAAADDTHEVGAGESFWSIAEKIVISSEPKASDHVIAEYWRRLIDVNRDRLPAPDHPDLLLPGTLLVLPPR